MTTIAREAMSATVQHPVRIAWWVVANALAAFVVGTVVCPVSREWSFWAFGVCFGVLQAPAVARSLREFVAWSLLTALFGIVAIFAGVFGFLFALGIFGFVSWIPIPVPLGGLALVIGLVAAAFVCGAVVGFGQSAVFVLRSPEPRSRAFLIASGVGAVVLVPSLLRSIGNCGPQDLTAIAIGGAYGLVTAAPLASLMNGSRS